MDAIIKTGYGLTLGIHRRIDATIHYITERMPVGNMYVNRNMIGAVVGVQPFGGERYREPGPKQEDLIISRDYASNVVFLPTPQQLVAMPAWFHY